MARPLIPFVQNGYYASRNWIPLVKGNGFTTSGGSEQEEVWETASGSIVTFDAVAAPLRQLSVAVEPVQSGTGDPSPENVRPISGWNSVTVNRTGVNVWDEEWEVGAYNTTTGAKSSTSAGRIRSANYISCKPNTAYYVAKPPVDGVLFYGSGKEYLGYTTTFNVVNTPNECHYMTFYSVTNYGESYNNDIPINYPATDTDYHAYSGNEYTIQLGETVYGGTLDVVNGKMTVDRAMIDCASITTWSIDRNAKRIYKIVSELVPASGGGVVADGLICNRFKSITANQIYANVEGVAISTGSALQFRINGLTDNPDVTLADVNSYFTANETKVVAKLAAPIPIQLTPVQIATLQGTNNVWSDAGDVTVEYRAQ